jgi:PLP dependent protein
MIAENLAVVRKQIELAASRRGVERSSITLLAVSKMVPARLILEAAAAGQRLFGESYVQEAQKKAIELKELLAATGSKQTGEEVHFDFIGSLQRNKAKYAVGYFDVIQTVDRYELALQLSRLASKAGLEQKVLVQVNISGETSKSGVHPEKTKQLCDNILSMPNLVLEGLMSIGTYFPPGTPEEARRSEFRAMFEHRQRLEQELCYTLPQLSMGMSEDYELAIEEGATLVRVGNAIFGKREQQ